MPRLPSLRWRQDQSPPGAGLTPIPSSPSPAPCCWVPSLQPVVAVGCGGGARRSNPWWRKTPRQTPPSERYADSTVSWPRRMRRGFFIGPALVSLGDGGADEKGSRLAALAGFPGQPGDHRVAPCRDAESPGCGVRRLLVPDPAQAPHAPPWRLQRIEQGKGFLSLFPERFGTGRVFTGILPSGAYAPGKTAAPGE